MNLSFETLVTTFIASSFLFLIACIVFISSRRIRAVGYQALTFICVLSVIRLIIPVEFFFSKNLRSRKILSCVIAVFRKPYTIVSQIPISVCIWQILLFIWLIGSTFHIYGYIRNYKKDKMLICYLGKEVSEQKNIPMSWRKFVNCMGYLINLRFTRCQVFLVLLFSHFQVLRFCCRSITIIQFMS